MGQFPQDLITNAFDCFRTSFGWKQANDPTGGTNPPPSYVISQAPVIESYVLFNPGIDYTAFGNTLLGILNTWQTQGKCNNPTAVVNAVVQQFQTMPSGMNPCATFPVTEMANCVAVCSFGYENGSPPAGVSASVCCYYIFVMAERTGAGTLSGAVMTALNTINTTSPPPPPATATTTRAFAHEPVKHVNGQPDIAGLRTKVKSWLQEAGRCVDAAVLIPWIESQLEDSNPASAPVVRTSGLIQESSTTTARLVFGWVDQSDDGPTAQLNRWFMLCLQETVKA
jgi:hypothetical protein